MDDQSCCDNPVCEHRFAELERRVEDLENDEYKQEIWAAIRSIEVSVANLNGRVAGYLMAGGLLGAVVAVIAQFALKR